MSLPVRFCSEGAEETLRDVLSRTMHRAIRRGLSCATALVAFAVAQAPCAAAATLPIPEGAALRYACTQPAFSGPLFEACPLPYDPRYLETFLRGFTRFTPENDFKMMYLEPFEGRFNFTVADEIASFAQSYDKTIRGHTLIWDEQNP